MPDSFVHLHQHTEYSMLDGAARIGDVVASAVADGQPAMGITDHGNMYGVLPFYKECRKQGVKPIIGTEAYMAHDARSERPPRRGRVDDSGGEVEGGRKLYYHLTLLAETNVGYKNLIQLASRAYMEGYYYKPRCLLPGQEILTDRGPVPIEDIRVGDLVLTHRGRLRRVTQTMSRDHDGPIFGVELNNRYRRVTWMTGEHPVLVRHRDGSRSWVEVQDLEAGRANTRQELSTWRSNVCMPKLRPDVEITSIATEDFVGEGWEPTGDGRFVKESMRSVRGPTRHYSRLVQNVDLDYDFGFFLGLYAAEGHCDRGTRVTFSLHRDEADLVERIKSMALTLVGKDAVLVGCPDRPDYKGVGVAIDSAPLARMMAGLCGRGAGAKSLPAFFHEAPAKFRMGLLDGVLAGDGADHGNTVILTQTSRTLAWQVRLLAADVHGSFACPATSWDGDDRHAPQYRLDVSIPGVGRHRRTSEDDEYAYRPVGAVHEQHYQGPVFNIEVEDDHSYVSDFAIHNCDWDLLEQHHEGVIATTGCLGGHVLQSLMNQGFDAALEKAARLQDIFGRDNLFVEIQDHGIPEQRRTNPQLLEIAKRLQAPLIATNDSHYVQRGDAVAHDALLCVQTGSLMSDPDRFKFHGDHHYLKTAGEMRRLFDEVASACDNSLWIAERCNVEIEFGKPQLPNFPLPEGFADDAAYLEHLTFEGARARWGDALPDEAVERLAYELKVIGDMGFCSYFLITWDLIRHARDADIRVGPGRGSAAGCAVAYCLRITDLDPIRYDLLFERFLNPSRISMPDIDMDFDSRYRDEMIRYAAERYGRDHVAQIVTFSTIKARAAVRDAARVLGQPYATGDRIAKAMPPLIMGRDTPLYACLEPHPKFEDGYKMATELREMYNADPDTKQVIDVAKGLEGLRRQDGIHAAAVVITKEPLTEYLPIQRKPESGQAPEDAPVVTQYEMGGVEELGLLKMDFLGLRNLDVISDTLELIRETRGIEVDIDNVPLDDVPTYELLRRADTIGVFQLEGGAMRALIKSLAPTEFEDVAALVALYRPGPMAANMHTDYADRKNGRQEVTYLHPDAADILGDTYALMVYQESMMRVAQRFAGYSLAEADNLRKACFPAGTRMLTRSRGYVPIEQVPTMSDRRVQVIDTMAATSRFETVDEVWSVGVKPVYRLTTSTGYTVEATANHPFLIDDRWTELGDVAPGDRVAVAGRTRTNGGSRISDAEVDLSALLISEGHTPDVRRIHRSAFFCNTDPELLDAFRAAYAARFGQEHHRGEVVVGVTRLRLTKSELLGLEPILGRLGLSADKTIPNCVINAPRRKVERFLGLYLCADGWADNSGVHFTSASKDVCLGLKRLLLRLGVVSNLHWRDIEGHGRYWTLSVSDKGQARRLLGCIRQHLTDRKLAKIRLWESTWSGGSSATNIGIPAVFLDAELTRRQEVTGRSRRSLGVDSGGYTTCSVLHRDTLRRLMYSERLEDLCTGDLVWDTVVSVEYVGDKECFDFRMANQHRPYAVVEDFLVHNCGKKNKELIAKERVKFTEGCERTGYGADLGTAWFDIIEPFADYAFNRSHAYGYGYVAYQTAFLKANYPAEYLSALLTSVKQSLEKAAVYLAECRTMGIEVKVPDVNRSASDFTPDLSDPEVQRIVFGLSAVRNVGEGLVELIVAEREAEGPYADFYDFCERVNTGVLNKRTVESLIKAGAFDSMGHPRKGLLQAFEQIVDQTVARRKEHDMGVQSLFGALDDGPSFDERVQIAEVEFDKKERLAHEKEMLGLYVSDHPLLGAERMLRRKSECTVGELADLDDGTRRTVGGVITGLNKKWTKRGDLMAVFTLEDLQGSIEVMVFPKTMAAIGHLLADDAVVLLGARVDRRDDTAKLIASDIELFEPMADGVPPLRLHLRPNQFDDATVARIKELFADFPGEAEVHILLGDKQVLRLPDEFLVGTQGGLVGELRALLGAEAVVI